MYISAIRGWVGWDGLGWDWISPGGVRCRASDGANEYEIRFSPIICVDKAATGGGQGARASCKDSGGATRQTIRAGIPPEVLSPFTLSPRFTCKHNVFRFPYLLSAKSYRYESASQQHDEAYLSTFIGQTGPFYESDSTWGSSLMD